MGQEARRTARRTVAPVAAVTAAATAGSAALAGSAAADGGPYGIFGQNQHVEYAAGAAVFTETPYGCSGGTYELLRFSGPAGPNNTHYMGCWKTYDVGMNLDGRLEAFAIGADGNLWHDWQTVAGGESWSGWHNLGEANGPFLPFPPGGEAGPRVYSGIGGWHWTPYGEMSISAPDANGTYWKRQQTTPNGGWGSWIRVG